MSEITWNDKTKKTYEEVTGSLPQFHRTIAQKLVKESAQALAIGRQSTTVEDQDLIKAFFDEVPPAFKDMMTRLLLKHGVEISEYIDD